MFDITEELKKLPDQPGVYIMHDEHDAIIYIGKAVSLRKRVHQYFQPSHDEGIKKAQMVRQIARFEYIVTDSELEALVLECNLIKEHRPKYNTMLRDDKTYPYIRVTLGEDFPRVLFSRQQKKDKSRYFGPYTSAGAVKDTIELVNKIYQLRTCNRNLPRDTGKERPCLNYHIHQCAGPCQGYISKEAYRERIDAVIEFLNGNYAPVLRSLEEKMNEASEQLEFEKAIEYRELLNSVRQIAQKQKITHTDYAPVLRSLEEKMNEASEQLEFEKAIEYRELLNSVRQIAQKQKITHTDGEDKDIIAYAADERDAVVQVFFIRDGKLIGRDHFYVRIGAEDTGAQILGTFVKQFYSGTPFIPREVMLPEAIDEPDILADWLSEKRGGRVYIRVPQKGMKEKLVELAQKNAQLVLSPFIPREVMLPEAIDEPEILADWLSQKRGGRVYIRVPQKGMKEKLVELAQKNAQLVLSQDREKMKREEGRTIGALKEIEKLLGMEKLVRVEAFDISNTNGFETVGSMIVYEKGKPKRSDYRKFKLKTISGPDDLVRVEAFDISNTNGFETVGSMIVYEKGKPKRSDYRKFKLKTISGPDDYASMHEVLTRRFTHGMRELSEMEEKELSGEYGSFTRFPDLIMMDGGRGQVNIALKVLDELKLNIPVCGMVKDDNHRTRGLYYKNVEIPIERSSEGFKLITRIQDEAHRFAIEYHRSLRSKEQVHSVLDDIPGIGPARRKALMKKYQSLEAIGGATREDLAATDAMNEQAAEAVYRFFRNVEE